MQFSSKQPKTISSPISIQLSKSSTSIVLGASKMPASKLLLLQQNHIKDSTTIMSTNASSTAAVPYINGQQNGSTKVVLVTSEPMEIDHSRNGKTTTSSNNGTDEELTSLTWLHDKNLLKVTDNASTKPQSQQAMSSKSSSSGAVTPTSDFVDDSGVSEDNASSVNSGSEQGSSSSSGSSSIYRSVRTTPKSFATTGHERDNNTVENEDIDDANNNTIQKNRENSNHNQVPPAANIIHLSPSGSSVVEYKTLSNLPQKSTIIPNTSSPLSNSNPVIVSTNNGTTANGATNVIKAISTQQSSIHSSTLSASTPHTHFHKKYIKAMNALNSDTITTTLTTTSIANSSQEAQISSPTTLMSISTPTTTIYTIPMQKEYSPAKYEHETVIVENEYPHSAINLVSNTNHRIYHGNETDRHSDEYVTPISSPKLQQQPAAPQKLSTSTAQSPSGISLSQSTVPLPLVSPNSAQNQPKPNNVPYDPFIHTNNKPPLSFSSLIFLAIEDAKEKALPVKEIYAWIVKHYPYFKTAPTGWKNSVRHNLSLNKCFQKVEKAPNMGKGSLWRVEQQYKQNLIIALTRSSYHPNTSAMEKATASLKNTPISPESPSLKSNKRPLDAELFPRLSKFMANMQNGNSVKIPASNNTTEVISNLIADKNYQIHNGNGEYGHANGDSVIVTTTHGIHTNHEHVMHPMDERNVERIARDWGVDSIDDVNAATAMLALKHGPKFFSETFQTGTPIITTKPSEDHTYSAGGGAKSGSAVNVIPVETEPIIHFNGNSSPPIAPHQVQIKYDSNSMNNHGTEVIIDNRHHSDNMSNGTSSDAAYESSEESQNDITREEEEARRHQEGVDAFLSFATEVSSMSSPLKRPPSADYVENVSVHNFNNNNNNNNNHLFANGNGSYYYNGGVSPLNQQFGQPHIYSYMSSPSPPKKSRTRTLRTKLKKKTTWLR
ncbi:DEP domain-containing protein DDB_G0279099 isoform X2 [Sitodiplosis mosellana]|uniref:DEP domain-containing protein DDB_G0279099 isoform X2 n=1 Tax=Sitodiplosis mosellana TaxID=263140 RepID=UPI002444577B|nr:DEP domain-containing protein DDB_G0279099 isoform X2 [Sitodiplosis mosellana]XP_055324175.1 DEP domain-containing protein DDB_G0279099 isoform X2 [Sitodiplosis mosellana]XP_055324185.1 DEP domain-containing protein DDB_G0279099 isoform X2 [Sitodiplosis mosellana]